MSGVISLRLSDDEMSRLDALVAETGRSRAFFLREALDAHLGELEYVYAVRAEVEAIRRGELSTVPLEELERELDSQSTARHCGQ